MINVRIVLRNCGPTTSRRASPKGEHAAARPSKRCGRRPHSAGYTKNLPFYDFHKMALANLDLWTLPATEQDAFEFLQDQNILVRARKCRAGHDAELNWTRRCYRCTIKSCRKEVGLRVGSWWKGDKLPFHTLVRFIFKFKRMMSGRNWEGVYCERPN